MKLFTRYNRINLVATGIVFLMAAIAFFFLLKYVLIKQVDEDLRIEQQEIRSYVKEHDQLPEAISVKDQKITFSAATDKVKTYFKTVPVYDSLENERDKFRQVTFTIAVKDQLYEVIVGKSLEGTENLERSIVLITISTILLMLITVFVINRLVLQKLWKPFYQSMSSMQEFKLGRSNKLNFVHSNIDEFNLLNKVLASAMDKVEKDYQSLKEFTENASHELQTPLAIIRSKLDLLIQDEHLSESQSYAVQGANDAIQKLTRLNQSLLLLAKIGNDQFSEKTIIPLKKKIEEKIVFFRELLQDKQLSLDITLEDIFIEANEQLIDIMLNNLFSNAIRHSLQKGSINIVLEAHHFKISNNSDNGKLDTSRLFHRFQQNADSSIGHGLGLSIVKQIADVSAFGLSYFFSEGRHYFIVSF